MTPPFGTFHTDYAFAWLLIAVVMIWFGSH
jgi:hypothetical protein